MKTIRAFGIYLVLGGLVAFGVSAAPVSWTTLEGCTIIPSPYNDGDSFHVRHEDKEYIFRLYFIDAPEEDSSFPQRIDEQGAYFGLDRGQVTDTGRAARDVVLDMLAKPFTVQTRWHSAQGRSRTPRYYAFVRSNDKDIGVELVARGLARVYGVRATTPEGEPANQYRARLLKTEDEARLAKTGAWALSRPLPEIHRRARNTVDTPTVIAPRVVATYSTQLPRRRLADIPRETVVRILEEFPDGWVEAQYTDSNGDVQDIYCLRWDLSLPEFSAPGAHLRAQSTP